MGGISRAHIIGLQSPFKTEPRYMGEEDCPNGAVDFLVIGGGFVLAAALIVIVVSYVAGGCHDINIIVTQIKNIIPTISYGVYFHFSKVFPDNYFHLPSFCLSKDIPSFTFTFNFYFSRSLTLTFRLSLFTFPLTFNVHF